MGRQPGRGNLSDSTAGRGKADGQAAAEGGIGNGQADVAVEEPQPVVVHRHHDRPPRIPDAVGIDEPLPRQDPLDGPVEPLHPILPLPDGTEDPEAVEAGQCLFRVCLAQILAVPRNNALGQGPGKPLRRRHRPERHAVVHPFS